jgi:CBS domain-containing protein
MRNKVHAPAADEVVDFLAETLPFSELTREVLLKLAAETTIDFVPTGERLLTQGESTPEHLLLIQRGGVKLTLTTEQGEERLVDRRGEGGSIGAPSIINESPTNLNVEAVEDTFVFKVPAKAFRELASSHAVVANYFFKNLSGAYLEKAFSDLRRQYTELLVSSPLHLFSTKVGELTRGEPEIVRNGSSIRLAAKRMVERGIGSVLVADPTGEPVGIITDKDLRRAVAEGEDFDAPVEFVMSSPLATVGTGEVCFEALMKMMAGRIHHLAAVEDERIVGVVTSHDILVLQGKSPMSIFRDIASKQSFEELYPIRETMPLVMGSLIEEGAKAGNISRMIAVLNDLILDKVLTMLTAEMGQPPVPFCWMILGSAGRKEQTLSTDQDNALVYSDPVDAYQAHAAEAYFAQFAEKAVGHLAACGFARDPADVMAVNPKWRMSYSDWLSSFSDILLRPEPERILEATIFFDFRSGYGRTSLGENLRNFLVEQGPKEEMFLHFLAKDALRAGPPLTFFRNFLVEKDGEHKNTLNLKEKCLVQFVDFARLFAMAEGVRETNTLDRLRGLFGDDDFASSLREDAVQAYEYVMQMRLLHQLRRIGEGETPDNYLRPEELSDLEKTTLKEAFGVIGRLQSHIKDTFRTSMG